MSVAKRQDRNGAWWVDFTYKHPDGRRERVRKPSPVNTKAGAEAYERQLRARLMEHGTLKDTSITVSRFWSEEYRKYIASTLRKSSVCTRTGWMETHILPAIGDMDISEVSERTMSQLSSRISDGGASPSTVNVILGGLHAMLSKAQAWGYVQSVPTFRRIRVPERAPAFLSFAQAEDVLRCPSLSPAGRAAIALGLRAGLRCGEIFGLRWRDVDLDGMKITVCGQLYRDGTYGPTKSGKVRTVPIPSSLAKILKGLNRGIGDAYVVDGFDGWASRRNLPGTVYGACGIEGVSGWHVLRHTYASHLVMRGAPIKVVQELLGHASLAMTMVYAHLSPESKTSAVSLLDGADAPPEKAEETEVIDFR